MKTKNLLLLTAVTSVMAIASFSKVSTKTDAAFIKSNDYSDNFNSKTISEQWFNNGAELKSDYTSFRLDCNTFEWGASINYSKYKVEKDCTLKFEISASEMNGWFGISFGNRSANGSFAIAQGAIVFSGYNSALFLNSTGSALKEANVSYGFSPIAIENLNKHSLVTINFKRSETDSAVSYKIDYLVTDMEGHEIGRVENIQMIDLDGYIGFNGMSSKIEIYNFDIYEGEEIVVHDDFSNSSAMYPSSGSPTAEWYSTYFEENSFGVGNVGRLNLKNIGSNVVYSEPYSKDYDNVYHLYQLNATFYLGYMDFDVESGFEVSKSNYNDRGTFFGIKRRTIGYTLYASNGTNSVSISSNKENANSTVELTLDVYSDGYAYLYSDDVDLRLKLNDVNGFFGLATRNFTNSAGKTGAQVDDFSYTRDIYMKRSDADCSNNFNGTKVTQLDGYDYYEFFYTNVDWFKSVGVSQSIYNNKTRNNGYMAFQNAAYNDCFGPRAKYNEAIVRFDATVTADASVGAECLGLQFAKPALSENYANVKSLGLVYSYQPTDELYETNLFSTKITPEEGAGFIRSKNGNPINLLKADTKIEFLYIIRDNTITMNLKSENGGDPVDYTVTCECDSMDGYISVFGANGSSFNLDNLSITNLDLDITESLYTGKSEYQETTRVNFANGYEDSLVVTDGNVVNNYLKLKEDGTVSTKYQTKDNIIRLNTKSIEDTLRVDYGDNVYVDITNNDAKKIVVHDGSQSYEEVLSEDFEYANATFEVQRFEGKLKIRYASGDKPLSVICDSVCEFNVTRSTGYNNVVVKAINGQAQLYGMSLFNLDNHITIEARNYDPAIDESNPWDEKDDEDGKGCKGDMTSLSLVISLLSISFASILLIKRLGGRKHE